MSYTDLNGGWEALSSMARLAATAAWHTAGWSLRLPMRVTRRALEVASAPDKAGDVVQEIRDNAAGALRELIALADLDSRSQGSNDGGSNEMVPGADVARRVVEAVPGTDVARKVVETIAPEEWSHALIPGDGRAARNGNVPLRAPGPRASRLVSRRPL